MASPSSSDPLSNNNIFHSIQIRLTSSNYLVWANQMTSLFEYQDLLSHIDGTSPAPPKTITSDGKTIENHLFKPWKDADRKAVILLNSSLSEESFPESIGFSTARDKWTALTAAYSNALIERVQNLRDQLHSIAKGNSTVADFGRRFKAIIDHLAAIGHPVDESDKTHSFFRGLGPAFETFSIALRAARPNISLRDLQAQAENHEIFSLSVQGSQPPTTAFSA
ncbi:hypothetical protein SSX86_008523 [Deinandra increscens subsp. villosa]|uniref:Gag protein n=1 Tax=Deinandra increscens subsp. villosa TaxID=3103831 RepID=A0AAP0H4L9_9ASTR